MRFSKVVYFYIAIVENELGKKRVRYDPKQIGNLVERKRS